MNITSTALQGLIEAAQQLAAENVRLEEEGTMLRAWSDDYYRWWQDEVTKRKELEIKVYDLEKLVGLKVNL